MAFLANRNGPCYAAGPAPRWQWVIATDNLPAGISLVTSGWPRLCFYRVAVGVVSHVSRSRDYPFNVITRIYIEICAPRSRVYYPASGFLGIVRLDFPASLRDSTPRITNCYSSNDSWISRRISVLEESCSSSSVPVHLLVSTPVHRIIPILAEHSQHSSTLPSDPTLETSIGDCSPTRRDRGAVSLFASQWGNLYSRRPATIRSLPARWLISLGNCHRGGSTKEADERDVPSRSSYFSRFSISSLLAPPNRSADADCLLWSLRRLPRRLQQTARLFGRDKRIFAGRCTARSIARKINNSFTVWVLRYVGDFPRLFHWYRLLKKKKTHSLRKENVFHSLFR